MPPREAGRLRAPGPGPGQDSGAPRGPTREGRVEASREDLREQVSHDDDALCPLVATGRLPHSRAHAGCPLAGCLRSPSAVASALSGQHADEDVGVGWINDESWVTWHGTRWIRPDVRSACHPGHTARSGGEPSPRARIFLFTQLSGESREGRAFPGPDRG